MTIGQILLSLVIIGVIFLIFKRKTNRGQAQTKITAPKIMLLQLGTHHQPFFESDTDIYSQFYTNITSTTVQTIGELKEIIENSSVDLYHIFLDIDQYGSVYDSFDNKTTLGTISNLMQERGTTYILFANNTESERFLKASEYMTVQTANIIQTIDRNGGEFLKFFQLLFQKVSSGQSLPMAWHDISPQVPNPPTKSGPLVVASMGAASVILMSDM